MLCSECVILVKKNNDLKYTGHNIVLSATAPVIQFIVTLLDKDAG